MPCLQGRAAARHEPRPLLGQRRRSVRERAAGGKAPVVIVPRAAAHSRMRHHSVPRPLIPSLPASLLLQINVKGESPPITRFTHPPTASSGLPLSASCRPACRRLLLSAAAPPAVPAFGAFRQGKGTVSFAAKLFGMSQISPLVLWTACIPNQKPRQTRFPGLVPVPPPPPCRCAQSPRFPLPFPQPLQPSSHPTSPHP